jgi:hypothetical protein
MKTATAMRISVKVKPLLDARELARPEPENGA